MPSFWWRIKGFPDGIWHTCALSSIKNIFTTCSFFLIESFTNDDALFCSTQLFSPLSPAFNPSPFPNNNNEICTLTFIRIFIYRYSASLYLFWNRTSRFEIKEIHVISYCKNNNIKERREYYRRKILKKKNLNRDWLNLNIFWWSRNKCIIASVFPRKIFFSFLLTSVNINICVTHKIGSYKTLYTM